MDIPIAELRIVAERLLAHTEQQGISHVRVGVDYYWSIPPDQRYNPYEEPASLTIGQLSDDWMELSRVLDGSAEPLGHHLVWLAGILHAVGEAIVT